MHRRDRPFVAEAVPDREERYLTDAVVVGKHVVARLPSSLPSVEVAAANGIPVARFRPPVGRRRHDRHEGKRLIGGDSAAVWYVELDGRGLFDDREREAAGIESKTLCQAGGTLAELVA